MDELDSRPAEGDDTVHESPSEELHALEEELQALETDVIPDEEPLLPSSGPMRTVFQTLGLLEQIVGALLLLLVLILVLAQVAQRYLHWAAPWTGELARLSMVWATFLLAGYLVAYPPFHVAIRVIDYVAKDRWLALVKLFVNVVILATTLVLIYGSYALVTTGVDQVTPAGELSMRFVNAIPLIGLVLVAVRAVLGIVIRDIPALRARSGGPP
jgi:TRAP-type C4-dicarboxylate transport system permease small subunit